ncbi:response regulator transcription factor, partial [bacterium]|nr:response regulator transcription factor [bacterium]
IERISSYMKRNKILIYSNSQYLRDIISRTLSSSNLVITAMSQHEITLLLESDDFDLVILSESSEATDMPQLLQIVKSLSTHSELIVIKENASRETILKALNIGCSYFIEHLSEIGNLPEKASNLMNNKTEKNTNNNPPVAVKETKNEPRLTANPALSKREKDIFYELIMGHKNMEIAKILGITEKTVKNHLWKIYKKHNVNNRTQLFHKLLAECPCTNILERFKPERIKKPGRVKKLFPVTS